MENNEMIALMQRQLKEIQTTLSGLQSLIINGDNSLHNEISDLKSQEQVVMQKLDKLAGDVKLVNEEGKLKTSYKDYSDEEIYILHNQKHMSWAKIAELIGCSKSTVIRKYKNYMFNSMEVDF